MPSDPRTDASPHIDRDRADPISVRNRYTFSSYNHPSEIPAPDDAAGLDQTRIHTSRSTATGESEDVPDKIVQNRTDRVMQRRSYLTGVREWYASINDNAEREPDINEESPSTLTHERKSTRPRYMTRGDSMYSFNSLGSDFEPDETPKEPPGENDTGRHAEDLDDLEKNTLRQMDYKTRRKHMMRIKIEYNITCKVPYPSCQMCLTIVQSYDKSTGLSD